MKEVPFRIARLFCLVSLIGGLLTSCVVYIRNVFNPHYQEFNSNTISTFDVIGATILLTITFGVIAGICGYFGGVFDDKEMTTEDKTRSAE